MRRFLGVIVAGVCLVWGSVAHAYELVQVLSGDTLLVKEDGREIRLELSGVWVPSPPSLGVHGEYLGEEARRAVEDLLLSRPAFIKEVAPPKRGQRTIEVRIRIGEQGEDDLAVLLAEAGFGLVNRSANADPDHLEAIYCAEREARRHHRGMHDGGFQRFVRQPEGTIVDMGIGNLAAPDPSRSGGGLQQYLRSQRSTPQTSRWNNGIHRSGTDAIRDYGSRMGLPHDSSALGR